MHADISHGLHDWYYYRSSEKSQVWKRIPMMLANYNNFMHIFLCSICWPLFVIIFIFCWPLYCLYFYDLWLLITFWYLQYFLTKMSMMFFNNNKFTLSVSFTFFSESHESNDVKYTALHLPTGDDNVTTANAPQVTPLGCWLVISCWTPWPSPFIIDTPAPPALSKLRSLGTAETITSTLTNKIHYIVNETITSTLTYKIHYIVNETITST